MRLAHLTAILLLCSQHALAQNLYVKTLGSLTSDPVGPCTAGTHFVNVTTHVESVCLNSTWRAVASGSGAVGRCAFWSAANTLSSDAECLYDSTTNYLDVNGTVEADFLKIPTGAAVGHILTSDISGNASWTAPLAGVTGTGTTGTIPKWTSSTALGNSIVVESTGEVNIAGRADIGNASAYPDQLNVTNDGVNNQISFGVQGSPVRGHLYSYNGGAYLVSNAEGTTPNPIDFYIENTYTPRLRIASEGVGIGTISPNSKLHVAGNINVDGTSPAANPAVTSNVRAGNATGTNIAGGTLTLQAGRSTGTGDGVINFEGPSVGTTGAALNASVSRWRMDNAALYPTTGATFYFPMSKGPEIGGPIHQAEMFSSGNDTVIVTGDGVAAVGRSKCSGTGGSCSSFSASSTVPNLTGWFDMIVDPTMNSGFPVFIGMVGTSMSIISCTNADCSTSFPSTVLTTIAGSHVSIDRGSTGKLFMAWADGTNLMYAYCTPVVVGGGPSVAVGPVGCSSTSSPFTVGAFVPDGISSQYLAPSVFIRVTTKAAPAIAEVPVIVYKGASPSLHYYYISRFCSGTGVSCSGSDITGGTVLTDANTVAGHNLGSSEGLDSMSGVLRVGNKIYFSLGRGADASHVAPYVCDNEECSTATAPTGVGGISYHFSYGLEGRWFKAPLNSPAGVAYHVYSGQCFTFPWCSTEGAAYLYLCTNASCSTWTRTDYTPTISNPYLDQLNGRWGNKARGLETPAGNIVVLAPDHTTVGYAGVTAVNLLLGTQSITGLSIGKAENRAAEIWSKGALTAGSVTIDGTGSGFGLLTLGSLATEPAGWGTINGNMYYNATSNRFRCYQAAAWKDCDVGQFDVLIGGNAYAGAVAVGTMTGYPHPAALRANGHDYLTVSPDGGVTVDLTDGGTEGSFRVSNKGFEELKVTPDGGVAVTKLRVLEPAGQDYVVVRAPALSAPWDLTLPSAAGATGAVLTASNGVGATTWGPIPLFGTCTLDGAATATCTATVPTGWKCVCSDGDASTLGVASVACSVATTTLTATSSVTLDTSPVFFTCGP